MDEHTCGDDMHGRIAAAYLDGGSGVVGVAREEPRAHLPGSPSAAVWFG